MKKKTSIFLKTLQRVIDSEKLIIPGDYIWIAVSGGMDSMALLYALYAIKEAKEFNIGALHIHHGLRNASDEEWTFVKKATEELGIPFYGKKVNVHEIREKEGVSVEEAARIARMDVYQKALSKTRFTKIATAHHAQDNAELFLLRLFRGSGSLGLSGMAYFRPDGIIRPFLNIWPDEIWDFVKENRIQYREDESNQDLRFDRNRVRHELFPLLEEKYTSGVKDALHRLSMLTRDEETWLSELVQEVVTQLDVKETKNTLTVSVKLLKRYPVALQRRLLREMICKMNGNLRHISFDHIASLLELITTPLEVSSQINLPGVCVMKKGSMLLFMKKKEGQRFCEGL